MVDHGYSNYTVEGTTVYCLLALNPKLPSDHWYGKEESLEYANFCGRYTNGYCVEVDVDRDEGDLLNYSDDPEIKQLLQIHKNVI